MSHFVYAKQWMKPNPWGAHGLQIADDIAARSARDPGTSHNIDVCLGETSVHVSRDRRLHLGTFENTELA